MKLDFDGYVYDGEWRSSYYYVENGTCKSLKIDANAPGNFTVEAKLRNGTSEHFAVSQDCPGSFDVLFTASATVIALLVAAVYYIQRH